MRLLIIGLNYSPEETGIGVYTSGLAQALARRGHCVTVIAAQPYFPQWRVFWGYSNTFSASYEEGVRVIRCPIYVPAKLTAGKRVAHYVSFLLSSIIPALHEAVVRRPQIILTVAPSLLSAFVGKAAAFLSGAQKWLHLQDFEVDAAVATGALRSGAITTRIAGWVESSALSNFSRISTISPNMCKRLVEKGVDGATVYLLRNWASEDVLCRSPCESSFRARWNIASRHVALYSGSIGHKQGIELLVAAARALEDSDLTFVICGEGPGRPALEEAARGLSNVIVRDIQPVRDLPDLLSLATVHLLPQISAAADLVLPSKLTNMLASGRPIVATAAAGTGLHYEVNQCGIATRPGSIAEFVAAISELLADPALRMRLGDEGRRKAEEALSLEKILSGFEDECRLVIGSGGRGAS